MHQYLLLNKVCFCLIPQYFLIICTRNIIWKSSFFNLYCLSPTDFQFIWYFSNIEEASRQKGVYKSDYSDNDWDWRQWWRALGEMSRLRCKTMTLGTHSVVLIRNASNTAKLSSSPMSIQNMLLQYLPVSVQMCEDFFGIYLHICWLSGLLARQVACGMTVTFSVAVLTTEHPVSLSWPVRF